MHVALTTGERLNDHIIDTRPHQVHIDADLIQMGAEGWEGPLEANIIVLNRLILHKVLIFLIYTVVSQMHELVRFSSLGWIGLGSKPDQTLFEHIDPQRLIASYEHIQAQIELMTVDEQRISHVPWDDHCILHIQIIQIVYDFYAAALAPVYRFYDPCVALWLQLGKLIEVGDEFV